MKNKNSQKKYQFKKRISSFDNQFKQIIYSNNLKISRLDLNKYNTINRPSLLLNLTNKKNYSTNRNYPSLKTYNNFTEKKKIKIFPKLYDLPLEKEKKILKIKKDKNLTLIPIKFLTIKQEDYNNKSSLTKNKKRSLYYYERNIEKLLISNKLRKKKNDKLTFSNPIISKSLKTKYNDHNSYTKRELNLLNNPNSIFYQLYHGTKEIAKNYGKYRNIKKEEKIKEYRNYFKEDEEEAGKQLFLLQKDIQITEQEKISGKIISSNTFFDLKILIE